MHGLAENGRVVPLERAAVDWQQPVFTGLDAGKSYQYCNDYRVTTAVKQLVKVRHNRPNLYHLVSEVSFSHNDALLVSLAGLPYRIKCSAADLANELNRFIDFVSRFAPDLRHARVIDMRLENLIVCSERKGRE